MRILLLGQLVGLVLPAGLACAAAARPGPAGPGPAAASSAAPRWERVDRLAGLPAEVRAALDGAVGRQAIAEPNEDWDPGCVRDGKPWQRLLFAGRAPGRWLVFVERGGFVLQQVLFALQEGRPGQWSKAGEWPVDRPVATLEELLAAVPPAGAPAGKPAP